MALSSYPLSYPRTIDISEGIVQMASLFCASIAVAANGNVAIITPLTDLNDGDVVVLSAREVMDAYESAKDEKNGFAPNEIFPMTAIYLTSLANMHISDGVS